MIFIVFLMQVAIKYWPNVDAIYKCYYGGSCSHVMTNLLCYSILVYVEEESQYMYKGTVLDTLCYI